MTYAVNQAISRFYLFINRTFGADEEGFEQFKGAVDSSRDNVIQYGEIDQFIRSTGELSDIDRAGVNAIWNELDRTKRGFNSYATAQVSENGSLNRNEETNLTKKIELFGRINTAIENAMTNMNSLGVQLTGGQGHDYEFNIDQATLAYETADLMLNTDGINQLADGQHTEDLQNLAESLLKKAAANIVKEQVLDNNSYKQILQQAGLTFSLTGTEASDLQEVIGEKIDEMLGNEVGLEAIAREIAHIIRGYLSSAGLGNYNPESVTEWNNGQGLNNLQKAVLTKKYKEALTTQTVDPQGDFNAFSTQLQNAIDKFIQTKIDGLSTTDRTFEQLLADVSSAVEQFQASPEYKALENIVRLNAIGPDAANSYGDEHGQTPEQRMCAILHYYAGLDDATLKAFIASPDYAKLLGNAYDAIIANPAAYGINSDSDLENMTKLQNAIMKYLKDNISTILISGGYIQAGKTDDEVNIDSVGMGAYALYWNYTGTYGIANNTNTNHDSNNVYGNGVYTNDDVIAAAKQFRDYVFATYQNNEYVMEEFEKTYSGGYSLAIGIENMSPNDIKTAMLQVLYAIKGHPQTNIEQTDNDDNGGGNIDPTIPEFTALTPEDLAQLNASIVIPSTNYDNSYSATYIQENYIMPVLRAKVTGYNGIDTDLFNVIFRYACKQTTYNTYNPQKYASDIINKFAEKYNEIQNCKTKNDFVNFYKSIYGEGYKVDEEKFEWKTDGSGLGIPINASGGINYGAISPNSVFGKINSIGQSLYNVARYSAGKEKAYAAYQTFMSYYAFALKALGEAIDFTLSPSQGSTAIDPAELRGNSFQYNVYNADGTSTTQSCNDQTSLIYSRHQRDFDEYDDFSDGAESQTGLYVGADRTGGGKRTFYIYMDTSKIAEKFWSFLSK